MAYAIITLPTAEPVTLADLKKHVRAEYYSEDDSYLLALAKAGREYVENFTGKVLAITVFELSLDSFPRGPIKIEKGPLNSVAAVKYISPETGLEVDHYQVDAVSDPGWIAPSTIAGWPSTMTTLNAVKIRFTAGYTTAPAPLKQAILELVGNWFEMREATSLERPSVVPYGVDDILTQYREWTF
jgi:uncharacterized phiE125 gp8 family phage protein